MFVTFGLALIYSVLPYSWATNYCVCTRHVDTPAYPCMDTNQIPASYLYGSIPGEDCMPVATNVITKHSWKAGILYNKVVYVQEDYNIAVRSCEQVPRGPFTYEHKCSPTMMPGKHLNPTTPTPPTPSTSTTTSTTTTTTTTTTPAPKSATPSTTPTTKTAVQVPVHVLPSTKCALPKLLQYLAMKTPAAHPQAKACPDTTHTAPEALMLDACTNAKSNPYTWRKELHVLTNCQNIPKGEPIALFVGTQPLPIYALFWRCINGGTSFEIIYQACSSAPIIDDAVNKFQVNLFYTISW